jgi:trimethylamine--corrinoid protein Co-methyltransferase
VKTIHSQITVLSPEELRLIHDSSAEILATIGVKAPYGPVLDRLEQAGCTVDRDAQVFRISSGLLEETLDIIKRLNRENYEGQAGERKIRAFVSTQVMMIDYGARIRRPGLRDDNLKGIALLNRLDNFPQAGAVTVPQDAPPSLSDLVCFRDIYAYSQKEGATYILTPLSARYILELNRLMGRSGAYLLETISPLSFKADTLEMALLFAENGGGLGLGPMAMSGATAPVTPAGTITLENAEVLASLFIIYTLSGRVSGYSAPVHAMDPSTMLCSFGSANQALFGIAHAQLMAFYGIHGMTNAGLSDALLPDYQCGLEKGITAAFNFLAGARGMGAQGIVGADQGNSFEQLVLDNEFAEYYNHIVSGFEVSPETIGLEAIREVGIGGNYLAEEHTGRYLRESFKASRIFLREGWTSWINGGGTGILDRAHAFVEDATAGYRQREPVIPAALLAEMDYIVDAAKEELQRGHPDV